MSEISTDLSLQSEVNSLTLADEQFTPAQREAIAGFLGVETQNPALVPYLAICAKWGLDPVAGQIWLIEQKIRGKNGQPDTYRQKPAVGRDGFLAIARRSPDYLGMDFDTVYSKDTFVVTRNGEEHTIFHEYRDIPGETAAGEDVSAYRGKLLGAYCKVHLKDRRPVYYFAPLKEHAQVGVNNSTGERYFRGSWSYTSVMIIKAAQSIALRLALGITGVVPVDETRPDEAEAPKPTPTIEPRAVLSPEDVIIEEGLSGAFERALIDAIERENEVTPNSWTAAKVRMRLGGKGDDGAGAIIDELNRSAEIRKQRVEDAVVVKRADELEPGDVIETGEGVLNVTVKDVLIEDPHETATILGGAGETLDVPADREFPLVPEAPTA